MKQDPRVYARIPDYEKFKSTLGLVLSSNLPAVHFRLATVGRVTVYAYTAGAWGGTCST